MQLQEPNALFVSVKENRGREELKRRVAEELSALMPLKTVRIPYNDYGLAAQIRREGRIVNEAFDDNGVVLTAFIPNHLSINSDDQIVSND